MLPARFQGEARTRVENQVGARLDVHFLPGFGHQRLPHAGVAADGDVQIVIGLELDLAVRSHGAMVLGLQHHDVVAGDGFMPLVAHLKAAVVFDLALHVALGAQVDQFLTRAVFEVQFIEPGALGVLRLRNTVRVLLAGSG